MTVRMLGSTSSEGAFARETPLNAAAVNTTESELAYLALRERPGWVRDVWQQLDALGALPANWDSYGAAKPAPASIEVAKIFLDGISRIVGVDRPHVDLAPSGNVALSWEFAKGTRNLEVEVLGTGLFRFAYLDERDESANREGTTSDPCEIASILTQW